MSRPYASRFNLKSIAYGLLTWASVSTGQACEACRKLYFQGMENAPKAAALYPQAKVVEYQLDISEKGLAPAGETVPDHSPPGGQSHSFKRTEARNH